MRPYIRELFTVAHINDGEITHLEAGPFIDWNDAYEWILEHGPEKNFYAVETEPVKWSKV